MYKNPTRVEMRTSSGETRNFIAASCVALGICLGCGCGLHMTLISSRSTHFHKRIVPVIWFGFLFVWAWFAVRMRVPVLLVIPAAMGVFGFFIMKKLVWVLADEVYDCGDCLLVRIGGVEERIALSNIVNVSSDIAFNRPRRVELRLAAPLRLGVRVAFIPKPWLRWNPFARNAVIDDLIARVQRARA